MNLKEHIRKVLREELYSPAGKEIIPNNIVIHKSNPMFRDRILEEGLKVRAGECYKIYVGYGVKCKPAIFATNSTNKRAWFDSTYDDDIWEINTKMIPDVKWYKDKHYESRSKHIVTFQNIPKEAITLKYKGTGSGDYNLWSKNSPNIVEEHIRKVLREELNEVRVPRNERVELYKDDNIIVVVPLTHRALQKYAHQCQWCINDDESEWEDYHKGKHAVIIQRNPKKPKIGIKYPIPSEIFTIEHYTDIDSIYYILGVKFSSNEERDDYMDSVTSSINNFATNIVYYSPSSSLYDQEDNYLPQYGYKISDIPNVTPEVIKIMDDFLQESEEMNLQEHIRKVLREELNSYVRRRVDLSDENVKNQIKKEILSHSNLLKQHDDVIIDFVLDFTTQELLSWFTQEEYDEYYDSVSDYIKENYSDFILEYFHETFKENDNSTYCFIKHSERYGGRGFTECFGSWYSFLNRFGSWLPNVDWNKVQEKLKTENKILLARPLEGHIYEYYFSVLKK